MADHTSIGLVAGIAIFAIVALAVVALAYSPYFAHTPRSGALSYVTVTATGTVSAVPSQYILYITANGTANTPAAATASLAQTISMINSSLIGYINGNVSAIQTTSYQLYRPYNSSLYTASEGISVTLPSGYAGNAITALSNVSNTYITGVAQQLSQLQIGSLSSTALAKAIQNATAQAQQAAGANVTLSVNSTAINGYGYIISPGPKLAFGPNEITVFSGTQSVTQSVTMVFSYN